MNIPIDISNVTLRTDRLILRPWKPDDVNDFYAYARVDGVGQMAGWKPHQSLEESQQILDLFIRERKTFALDYQGKVIGSLGLERYPEEAFPELAAAQGREIGYALSKDYWGLGLMPEAVRTVIHYLFNTLGCDFIQCGHFTWNRQSARVIEKCGFHYVKNLPIETRCGTLETAQQYILYRSEITDSPSAAPDLSQTR